MVLFYFQQRLFIRKLLLEFSSWVGGDVSASHQLPNDEADVDEGAVVAARHPRYDVSNEIAQRVGRTIFLKEKTRNIL